MIFGGIKLKKVLLLAVIIAVSFVVFGIVNAQVDTGLKALAETSGLSQQSIFVTIARIIRIVLGLLGVILVGLIVYAGFLWMTAAGDPKKVETAKKILTNAVIGVLIVASAFGITQFILSSMLQVAEERAGGRGVGGGGMGGGFGEANFILRGITPSGAVPIRNVTVRATFNSEVDGATVAGNFTVTRASDGSAVDGTLTTARNTIEFTPSENCPEPNEDRKCFDADTAYNIRATTNLRDIGGRSLVCGGFAPACDGNFTTGNLVDVSGPSVSVTAPDNGESISTDSVIVLQALVTDDAGISQVEFFVDGAFVGADAPGGATPLEFIGASEWSTRGVTTGRHNITARAYDIDANTANSAAISVNIRPAHCFNGVRDADEGGTDCGGEDCGACDGARCDGDADCTSGLCRGGICVSSPRIVEVSPNSGRVGNYITISGEFFGVETGRVVFLGAPGAGDDREAGLAPCATAWQGDEVVVLVPEGAVDGPIQLCASNGECDATNDERGFAIADFDVNETARPGICGINPRTGISGDAITISGSQLGESQEGNSATLGGRDISPSSWGDIEIRGTVPNISQGRYPVAVTVAGEQSNAVYFRAVSREAGTVPSIISITPAGGPREEYIQILGTNFGRDVGRVIFRNSASGDEANGLTNFPAQCGSNYWREDSITIKVPQQYLNRENTSDGGYEARVVRSDGAESGSVDFSISAGVAGPGICRINPNNGPANTSVDIYGERFGNIGGQLRFSLDRNAIIGSWTDRSISSFVPAAAETGAVNAIVGEAVSNGVNFTVRDCNTSGCGEGEECCRSGVCVPEGEECAGGPRAGGFAWRFSTGIIPTVPRVIEECREGASPSPSPWDKRRGGNNVCVNAVINVRFSTNINLDTINDDNILVHRCTGGGENPCETLTRVDGMIESYENGFQFTPDGGNFVPASQYYVYLTTGIQGAGADGEYMLEDARMCGEGNSYCFGFAMRAGDDPCEVGSVAVDPASFTIEEQDGTAVYNASALDQDDICIALNSSAYDWAWTVTEENGAPTLDAVITNNDLIGGGDDGTDPDGNIDARQIATGLLETPPDPALHVNAEIILERVSDFGQLAVDFTDPEVSSKWPACNTACINSEIGAEFNTSMDDSSLTREGNFVVTQCVNENCRRFGENLAGDVTYDEETLTAIFNHDGLERNTYYRVIIKGGAGGVKSSSGTELIKTNYGINNRDYSWVFKTRDSDEPCSIDSIGVEPERATLKYIGEIKNYNATAIGAPDDCNPNGQRLIATDYNWGWESAVPTVADFFMEGGMFLDVLPRFKDIVGCSNICLHTGTKSGIPICGNAVRERGEDCDDGNTEAGDGCDINCLNEGALIGGSVCGNGDIGDGEDCDDGNRSDGDGCSTDCLNEGSVTGPLAFCGNGRTEDGEDCDDGNLIVGDGCNEICLHEGKNPCGGVGAMNCCGNGRTEDGEDCDDGNILNKDGCSSRCLNEGSSINHRSICGNGAGVLDLERGEECEFPNPPSGDRRIDPLQSIAAISGGETLVRARAEGKEGEGVLTVACVCRNNDDCAGGGLPENLACGINRCCSARPRVEMVKPSDGSLNVCRNALIAVRFDQIMDAESLRSEVRMVSVKPCLREGGIEGWCEDGLSGRISTIDFEGKTDLIITPTTALPANRDIRVTILGDGGEAIGVKNKLGIKMSRDYSFSFRTGGDVCLIDKIEITAGGNPQPITFTQVVDRTVVAHAISLKGGIPQEIFGIPELYNWSWNWVNNDLELLRMSDTDLQNRKILTPLLKKGKTRIESTATITEDRVSERSTVDKKHSAKADIIVMICINPWPGRPRVGAWSPYVFEGTNFMIYYCRDSGDEGMDDDLPGLAVTPTIAPIPSILEEYILKVNCGSSESCNTGDALGIRVAKNEEHFSPMFWYAKQGFRGNPVVVKIDEFEAIEDGRTIYVNAFNNNPRGLPSYFTNIYILSYTQNAGTDTQEIHSQISDNITFGINIDNLDLKDSITRDTKRLSDVRITERYLKDYATTHKKCSATTTISCNLDSDCPSEESCVPVYPLLESGSFMPRFTNSNWPSWQSVLEKEIGKILPVDPLNKFSNCAGFDAKTCYNSTSRNFKWPIDSNVYFYENCAVDNYTFLFNLEFPEARWTIGPLHPDFRYTLRVIDPDWHVDEMSNYCALPARAPGGAVAESRCGNGAKEAGEVCDDGVLNGTYNRCKIDCTGLGLYCGDGRRQTPPIGVEICDAGELNGQYNHCSWDCRQLRGSYCGDRVRNGTETCDGEVETLDTDCRITEDGYRTQKARTCMADCSDWNAWSACLPVGSCGNGIKDGTNEQCDDGNSSNQDTCTNECKNSYCGDGFVREGFEQCDMGSLNGTRCSPGVGLTCSYCSNSCALLTISRIMPLESESEEEPSTPSPLTELPGLPPEPPRF